MVSSIVAGTWLGKRAPLNCLAGPTPQTELNAVYGFPIASSDAWRMCLASLLTNLRLLLADEDNFCEVGCQTRTRKERLGTSGRERRL